MPVTPQMSVAMRLIISPLINPSRATLSSCAAPATTIWFAWHSVLTMVNDIASIRYHVISALAGEPNNSKTDSGNTL